MYVSTSFVGPSVRFVTTVEFKAEMVILYGIEPPYTRTPTGWQLSAFVTFVTIVMFTEGCGVMQESVLPAVEIV